MKESDVRDKAFAMPLCSPAYPRGPYRFNNREYLIITYETDIDLLREFVPAPLEVTEPLVKFEVIRMPDSTGFGDYTESGQVIPVSFRGRKGGYTHAMYLDDLPPIAAGREIWGFPKKLANPKLYVVQETLMGILDYETTRIATATMGYKYESLNHKKVHESMVSPCYLLKLIPHVDGTTRVCELVEYELQDVVIKGAWTGPAQLELFHHALAPIALLPVKKVVSAVHVLSDLVLPYGKVVYDYLK
ncbi:acetoacetate decarboxylase [Legionella birminghamensis]|uniref:Acetoacetate decarboxylase n=1 Tax=Legionella birminghamensis TaxID=28083 RepID=A0A378ID09_9GAMM|nr:acetoacetate decarboxylase [Legionella birminghamensis]KTC71722.1 acetoacetate decarboxylase [Legionella birminghamensis]STX32441.1 acetoacetate decarboxylase [Legionella birminghamensis]